jgi:hypothetical protein
MLCTAEIMYEHARLCIAINFKIEYWLFPKLAKGIRELYMIPVLLDEEYWSFRYRSTILVFQYCKCTILVHPVLYIYDTGFPVL